MSKREHPSFSQWQTRWRNSWVCQSPSRRQFGKFIVSERTHLIYASRDHKNRSTNQRALLIHASRDDYGRTTNQCRLPISNSISKNIQRRPIRQGYHWCSSWRRPSGLPWSSHFLVDETNLTQLLWPRLAGYRRTLISIRICLHPRISCRPNTLLSRSLFLIRLRLHLANMILLHFPTPCSSTWIRSREIWCCAIRQTAKSLYCNPCGWDECSLLPSELMQILNLHLNCLLLSDHESWYIQISQTVKMMLWSYHRSIQKVVHHCLGTLWHPLSCPLVLNALFSAVRAFSLSIKR
jgi:hypothetical protein